MIFILRCSTGRKKVCQKVFPPDDEVMFSVLSACKEHGIALDYPSGIGSNNSNNGDELFGKRISMGVYGAFSDLGVL